MLAMVHICCDMGARSIWASRGFDNKEGGSTRASLDRMATLPDFDTCLAFRKFGGWRRSSCPKHFKSSQYGGTLSR